MTRSPSPRRLATRRALASVAAATLIVGGASACGSSDDDEPAGTSGSGGATAEAPAADPGKKVRVGAFILASANSYSQVDVEGIEQAVAEDGNATVEVFDGEFSGATQRQQIQDAAASGNFDAFVIFPNDGAAVAPAVEEAWSEDQIPSVAAYSVIGKDFSNGEPQVDGVVGTVWIPILDIGRQTGEMTVAACAELHADADPCQVAYMAGDVGATFEQAKLQEFEKVIGGAEQAIELVATGSGGFLIANGNKEAQNMLQAHPDLNVIASASDQQSIGIERAIRDRGLEGQVTIVSDGACEQGVEAVDAGDWYGTGVFLPIAEGQLATEMAIAAARGEMPKKPVVSLRDEHSPVGPTYDQQDDVEFEAEWRC